ncbi:MAG: 16S rRNA (uracil(1498)-N(3))-methyltransferase [Neisseriales bacterium]|nr:MAG: 16S rRNA (uracil(1498)-N(3))-methyltransferase [Neisseriales bacterium]
MPRFYVATSPRIGKWQLPESVVRHIHVLRLKAGQTLALFCGDGYEYPATLENITRQTAWAQVGAPQHIDRECPLWIGLAQGISCSESMVFTLQKGVEMGVCAFQPLLMKRSIGKQSQQDLVAKLARWQAIIIAACEQCGRNIIPTIYPVQSFSSWVNRLRSDVSTKWLLSPDATTMPSDERPSKIWMMVGPEGGLDPQEQQLAIQNGWLAVRLGPRVLRTETAALSAVSALQALWGDYCITGLKSETVTRYPAQ